MLHFVASPFWAMEPPAHGVSSLHDAVRVFGLKSPKRTAFVWEPTSLAAGSIGFVASPFRAMEPAANDVGSHTNAVRFGDFKPRSGVML
jgi:hypothetical protein